MSYVTLLMWTIFGMEPVAMKTIDKTRCFENHR